MWGLFECLCLWVGCVLVLVVGVGCRSSVVGGQCGDSSWTCVRASMISFRAALNFA